MRQKQKEKIEFEELPELSQLEAELKREQYRHRYGRTLRSTIFVLIVVAAAAVLAATIWLPVFRIYGQSMTPTVSEGEIVVSMKGMDFEKGDVVAIWFGNKLLVKRVIAAPGEWVDIDQDGNVYVNSQLLDEPYVSERALGECNIELPYQVPEGRYFVMGDHRSTSQDSRSSAVGCIAEEQIVGRIVMRVWPLASFGKVD